MYPSTDVFWARRDETGASTSKRGNHRNIAFSFIDIPPGEPFTPD